MLSTFWWPYREVTTNKIVMIFLLPSNAKQKNDVRECFNGLRYSTYCKYLCRVRVTILKDWKIMFANLQNCAAFKNKSWGSALCNWAASCKGLFTQKWLVSAKLHLYTLKRTTAICLKSIWLKVTSIKFSYSNRIDSRHQRKSKKCQASVLHIYYT